MSRKEQQHGGVKLTAKTARTLAMQEFGTARGLTKSTSFVGAYFMEFGNLRIEICADVACIAVRVVLAHGTGSSVKYFDPDNLQENFKAIQTQNLSPPWFLVCSRCLSKKNPRPATAGSVKSFQRTHK